MFYIQHSKEGGAESIASELYRNLPNPDDPHYQEELDIARDVCAIAYLGMSLRSRRTYALAHSFYSDLGGSDTVSCFCIDLRVFLWSNHCITDGFGPSNLPHGNGAPSRGSKEGA